MTDTDCDIYACGQAGRWPHRGKLVTQARAAAGPVGGQSLLVTGAYSNVDSLLQPACEDPVRAFHVTIEIHLSTLKVR